MLALFPSLLSWSQLSPFIIRITLAAVFLVWSYQTFKKSDSTNTEKGVACLQAVGSLLLIVGYATQGVAALAGLDLLVRIIGKIKNRQFLTAGINYYLILLVLAISLLLTGAGLYSMDLPL